MEIIEFKKITSRISRNTKLRKDNKIGMCKLSILDSLNDFIGIAFEMTNVIIKLR